MAMYSFNATAPPPPPRLTILASGVSTPGFEARTKLFRIGISTRRPEPPICFASTMDGKYGTTSAGTRSMRLLAVSTDFRGSDASFSLICALVDGMLPVTG
ncbi:hypothetical protein D3C74_268560 [compost metagenome]